MDCDLLLDRRQLLVRLRTSYSEKELAHDFSRVAYRLLVAGAPLWPILTLLGQYLLEL